MKKLNKPPAIPKTIHYGKGEGFNHNYSFIFSDELPYLKRERKVKNMEKYRK